MVQTERRTNIRTLRLYDWIGQVGRFSENSFNTNFLSDLVIKQVILLIFLKVLWLISANWCLKKSCFRTRFEVVWVRFHVNFKKYEFYVKILKNIGYLDGFCRFSIDFVSGSVLGKKLINYLKKIYIFFKVLFEKLY